MFFFFKNMLYSYMGFMGSFQSPLSDGGGGFCDEGCESCANQTATSCEKGVIPPCSGMFTRQDMDRVMERLGMRNEAEEIESLSWMGSCQDCTFLQGVSLLEEKKASMDELKRAFAVFDDNGDGFITEVELHKIMHKLGLKEGKELENCRKMIRAFDGNGDGKIDLDEFKLLLENTV
ncbi:hypothetical protein H6P81_003022 [Aristolochia fimbriata]|uniref:EF-hand domain-containing protein n=1 Tax=Aristolochia fimbriata TaxID=158543 RepID=A0AAV7FD74_ARIFI|nr:hypothetical protein H6P81_003022 [Aristolochia fimbriata]